VREKDSHILAVDGEIFIQDQRFTSLVKENNQWTLMVRKLFHTVDQGLHPGPALDLTGQGEHTTSERLW